MKCPSFGIDLAISGRVEELLFGARVEQSDMGDTIIRNLQKPIWRTLLA